MQKILELKIPIRIISEANTGFSLRNPKMTWVRLKKRKEEQKNAIWKHWIANGHEAYQIEPRCHVKLIRIAPRQLDDDNLAYAFKHIRDTISDLIKPGMAKGRADSKDITFEYAQEKGKVKEYGIKIEVYS